MPNPSPLRRLAVLAALAATLATGSAAGREVPGFGVVAFPNSCKPAVAARLDRAVARLHAFDGPEDDFLAVAKADPACAIAWWGAAMSVRGNPLAGPPDEAASASGRAYLAKALAKEPGSAFERGLIDALSVYYRDPGPGGHRARTAAYEAEMERLAAAHSDDPEVQSFAGLAILEAVDLTDKSYARQLKAGAILEKVWATYPEHPGAPHYLIHAYDYAPLAARALPAARRYAGIASPSMHAQHMPSHIYSMLGMWAESIAANRDAARLGGHGAHAASAKLDAADPHGMDFIAYARLQLAQDREVAAALARAERSEERTIAAARYLLERGDWTGAAAMPVSQGSPLDQLTVRFVRALGAARAGRPPAEACQEVAALRALRPAIERREGAYWAGLVDVYGTAAEAWAARIEGKPEEALRLMLAAADLDDGREKHILLENKLLPIRELYGELLAELGRPAEALVAFEESLKSSLNRLRSYLGAARAARDLGQAEEARRRYGQVAALGRDADPGRPEIVEARSYPPQGR